MVHRRAALPLLFVAAFSLAGCFGEDDKVQKLLKGRKVFQAECQGCHVVEAPRNRTGPHLVGIMGREPGSVATYPEYSPALQRADFAWDAEHLRAYIKDPEGLVPGTSMAYAGLEDEDQIEALLAYLKAPQAAEKAYEEKQAESGGDGGED